MTYPTAVAWYVANFCRPQRHAHAESDLRACMIRTLSELQQVGSSAAPSDAPPLPSLSQPNRSELPTNQLEEPVDIAEIKSIRVVEIEAPIHGMNAEQVAKNYLRNLGYNVCRPSNAKESAAI